MASIIQACEMVGVARSTLLYYERIGLISPKRNPDNGYRNYSRDDIQTILLIRQLQKAGFSLKEADEVMKGHLDPELILSRYHALEREIEALNVALEVVKSLAVHATGKEPETSSQVNQAGRWHAELEEAAGDAHARWLKCLGFSEKEQLYIRWVTRSLHNSGEYMKDFFLVYEKMKRQGPGSRAAIMNSFSRIPDNSKIESILDIGCGKGQSSLILAEISQAVITAMDNHQPFLDHLTIQAEALGVCDRIKIRNISMLDLPFTDSSFDLIWSECSAYFIGFKKALHDWKPLIRNNGHIFISDAVWLTDKPSSACADYFQIEYPGMSNVKTRKQEACKAGYKIVSHFILPRQDWLDFYDDMEECVNQAVEQNGMTRAYEKMISEIEIGRVYGEEYGSLCLLLSPNA